MSSDNNLWGSHEMFSKKEKEDIAKKEMQQALKDKMMGGKNGGSGGLTLGGANSKAMRQLGAAAGDKKVTESGGTTASNLDNTNREIGSLVTSRLPLVGKESPAGDWNDV